MVSNSLSVVPEKKYTLRGPLQDFLVTKMRTWTLRLTQGKAIDIKVKKRLVGDSMGLENNPSQSYSLFSRKNILNVSE